MSTPQLRIGILGAGAMGCLFAARLARAGHPVTMVDVRDEALAALRREGVTLVDDEGCHNHPVRACRPEALQPGVAAWLLLTKTQATQAALAGVSRTFGPGVTVLSLQNGIGHHEALRSHAGQAQMLVGMTTWPARLVADGVAQTSGAGLIRFVALEGSAATPEARALERALCGAGLSAQYSEQAFSAIWEKLAFNTAFNGICGVTRVTADGIGQVPAARELARNVAQEVLAVAAASGVAVDRERTLATMAHAMENHKGHRPSMLQDLLAGRPTEVEAIHGAVVRHAGRLGVPVPSTAALAALVRLCEHAAVQGQGA